MSVCDSDVSARKRLCGLLMPRLSSLSQKSLQKPGQAMQARPLGREGMLKQEELVVLAAGAASPEHTGLSTCCGRCQAVHVCCHVDHRASQ